MLLKSAATFLLVPALASPTLLLFFFPPKILPFAHVTSDYYYYYIILTALKIVFFLATHWTCMKGSVRYDTPTTDKLNLDDTFQTL